MNMKISPVVGDVAKEKSTPTLLCERREAVSKVKWLLEHLPLWQRGNEGDFRLLQHSVAGLCIVALLSACGDKPSTTALAAKEAETSIVQTASAAGLPADAPAIGTDIKDVVKPAATKTTTASTTDENGATVTKIMWEDLVPEDYKPEAIMAKYVDQIEKLEEGSPEEIKLFAKLQAEFNSAPSNEKLAGKTVRIPGFISPLDENNGMVGEFLLVPYFGACIHSPPPPINQTVLVKPQEGKSVAMKDIYDPVWVIGEMAVEPVTTDLAQAGYQIKNARMEAYVPEIDNVNN